MALPAPDPGPAHRLRSRGHADDLAPRFSQEHKGRGDELAELGRDFDRMSGELRALMDNQRRLLHDVSHELRSPLAPAGGHRTGAPAA
ncbi:hypothetical protein LP420_35905 [Massilia sp. B-10]|nr:hypothetical protein LP420_35905 [Massilia sp. B-10]